MELTVKRLDKDMVFVENEQGLTFGVPKELFFKPSIGDIYIIRKVIISFNDEMKLNIE